MPSMIPRGGWDDEEPKPFHLASIRRFSREVFNNRPNQAISRLSKIFILHNRRNQLM